MASDREIATDVVGYLAGCFSIKSYTSINSYS